MFSGTVNGGNLAGATAVCTLELASGSSTGTISGFGTRYQNFANVTIDNGARWVLDGTVAAGTTVAFAPGGSGSLTLVNPGSMTARLRISAPGITLSLSGVTNATGVSLSAGNVLTVTESGGPGVALRFNPTQLFTGAAFSEVMSGGAANITVSGTTIPPPPVVLSVTASPATGNVAIGSLVTLTVTMSEAVTISGGTPSLTLNNGGTATYDAVRSGGTTLVFDYTVLSTATTAPALAVTGFDANGATIEDASENSANFSGVAATFSGLAINIAPSDAVTVACAAILREPPSTALLVQTITQIEDGQTTLAQFETGLIASEQAFYSTLPALVTIDAFYGATPSSALLTTVAAATTAMSYDTAVELHNLGYSDPMFGTILGADWGADPGSEFNALYKGDATGTTAGYTVFLDAAYQTEFGIQPTAVNAQFLLDDIPGLAALLSGGGNTAAPDSDHGRAMYGYMFYLGQDDRIGHYAAAADEFLQAAANGSVTYGPELTAEFPPSTGAAMAAASSTSATSSTGARVPPVQT